MPTADVSSPGLSQSQARRPLAGLLVVRIAIVGLLLAGTVLYQPQSRADTVPPTLWLFYWVTAIVCGHALLSLLLLRRARSLQLFAQAQVVFDLLLAAVLIYLSGGVESPLAFLLLLVIVSANFFLSRRDVLIVAAAAAILYGSLVDLQYYQFLPDLGQLASPKALNPREVFYAVFVTLTACLLTALLSGLLAARLRRSELARERSEIDYKELESLNRAIQGNIASGLLIVNPGGRIRFFNPEAQRITGYSLHEVYDRRLEELFPLFAENTRLADSFERAEGALTTRRGETLILGFNLSPVYSPEGETLGRMVNFQDLTRIKAMEAQIKRAERLAAVGTLASGLAHEIRNPLASISGSVQLLMEQEYLREDDRRLMGIVVREADRLSGLLSEFLTYARPPQPKLERINMAQHLDELLQMAGRDSRFLHITLVRRYPGEVWMDLDPVQLRQVLWNLLSNAADALGGEGTIIVAAREIEQEICVEDSGSGISRELRAKVFDPFFSTKPNGTGLGLATVHAIVDAHGGQIQITDGELGGARMVLRFPVADGRSKLG